MKRVLFILLFLVASLNVSALIDCPLEGRVYRCDSDNVVSGTLNLQQNSIHLVGMDIIIDGSDGTSGSERDGDDATLIINTDAKIFLDNTNITLNGGDGFSEGGEDGGDGGDSILTFNSGKLKIANSTINLNGGNGGNGINADPGRSDDGGRGGRGIVRIYSTDVLSTPGTSITSTAGSSGSGDVDCDGSTERARGPIVEPFPDTLVVNGSGTKNISFDYTSNPIDAASAEVCGNDVGLDGRGGAHTLVDYDNGNFIIAGTYTIGWGSGGNYQISGDDDATSGNDGELVWSVTNADTITSSAKIVFSGNTNPNTCKSEENGDSVSCANQDAISITFESTDLINFTNAQFLITGHEGLDGEAGSEGSRGGRASAINYFQNSSRISWENTTFTLTGLEGGLGETDSATGYPGAGGSVSFESHGVWEEKNSTSTLSTGDQGSGGSTGHSSAGGSGDLDFSQYEKWTVINGSLDWETGIVRSDGKGGALEYFTNNVTFQNSELDADIPTSGKSPSKIQVGTQNDFFMNQSSIFINSKSSSSCKDVRFNFTSMKLFELRDSVLNASVNDACDVFYEHDGEEFNYVRSQIHTQTGSGQAFTNYSLSSTNNWLPGLLRWNYTELGATNTVNVFSDTLPTYNGSRESITRTGTWSWNVTPVQVVYDEYFTRIDNPSIVKASNDLGPSLYTITNFTCQVSISSGSELSGQPQYNFSWYENETLSSSQAYANVADGLVNSTIQINGSDTEVFDVWKCVVNTKNSTGAWNRQNNVSEQVNHTYPYNVSVWIGQKKVSAGSLKDQYLSSATNITLSRGAINEYVQRNCTGNSCVIPLEFRSGTDARINVTRFNASWGVSNPLTNSTPRLLLPLTFNSSQEGNVQLSDLFITYFDTEQTSIKVEASTASESQELFISVLHSKINFDFTRSFVEFFDVFPLWSSQKGVEPAYQTKEHSIFNVNRGQDANHTYEVRIKIENGTSTSCAQVFMDTDNTRSGSFEVVESNYTQFEVEEWPTDNQTRLWAWTDFNNCNSSAVRSFFPEFVIKSKATVSVNTTNFWVED